VREFNIYNKNDISTVRSVSRYIKDTENKSVIDSKLLRDASAFISQETHHSVEHRSYNRKIEELYNYPMEEKNVWVRTLLMEIENRHNGHLRALALTCSLEHITATLSELLLGTENGLYLLHRMSPSVCARQQLILYCLLL
jgi:predicted metal-dependent hydrolase